MMMNRRTLGRMAATLALACSVAVPWAARAADEAPDEEEIIDADEPTDAEIEALAAELED